MARGKAHGEDVKAAVMAALLAGQGVTEVARRYRLSESTVQTWKGQLRGLEPEKREEWSDLVSGCLREFLTTLRVQAEQARDPDYIKKQPGSELAVLFGVIADKAFRILEAAESAGDASGPASDGSGCDSERGPLADSPAPASAGGVADTGGNGGAAPDGRGDAAAPRQE